MSAYDTHEATRNPRVVAEVLARRVAAEWEGSTQAAAGIRARVLVRDLAWAGIQAEPHEAHTLLNAVAAWDAKEHYSTDTHLCIRAYLDDALFAICGSES